MTTVAPSVSFMPSEAPLVLFFSSAKPSTSAAPSVSLAPSKSASPSASPSSRSPSLPTPRPTPGVPFVYRAEGDSSFGHQWQDQYTLAHQLAFRRPGWSWNDPTSGSAPFCYRDKCYDVSEACEKLGGELLHKSVCSFPDDVKIAGPSCWRGACSADGQKVCEVNNGITIGEPDGSGGPQWCILQGEHFMIGPMCYGEECYTSAASEACAAAKGLMWNDKYCFMDGYFTPVGPICWDNFCVFGDAKIKCESLGGTLFAERWCLLPGCDRTVIGPTCSSAPNEPSAQCFQTDTIKLCNKLKGTQFGNRFCVLDGTDWTFIGPTVYQRTETIGQTNDFCRELRQGLSGYFNFMDSYEIAGRFCLVKQRIPTTTPFCTDQGCDTAMGKRFCDRFGGKALAGGFMCSLCDAFRQVVGPLTWNGTVLEGNPTFCEGSFCAIPHTEESISVNLRCPASAPVISRCGAFGGAKGFENLTEENTTADGDGQTADDDDDDGDSKTSGSIKRGRMRAFVLFATLLWMAQSLYFLRW
ncbi:hypothetical protein ACA910_004196 [Epithemia clementina (nom. ined.)]